MNWIERTANDAMKAYIVDELGPVIKSAIDDAVLKATKARAFEEVADAPFHWKGKWMVCKRASGRFAAGQTYWVGESVWGYWAYPDYEYDNSRSWIPRCKINLFFSPAAPRCLAKPQNG